jgi:hypothetical protein
MSSQRFSRLAGPALTLGGALWITIHLLVFIDGLLTGKLVWATNAHQPLLMYIYYLLQPISSLFMGLGLLGGFGRREGRAKRLGMIGLVLASIGIITSIIYLIFLTISATPLSGALGVLKSSANALNGLSTLAATLILGCAALRTHMLPRPIAWTLIVIGIVTAPILLVTPLPIGPAWATDTIAFFLSGIGYTAVGVKMLSIDRKVSQQQAQVSTIME